MAHMPHNPLDALFSGMKAHPSGPFSGVHGALESLICAYLAKQPGVTCLIVPTDDRARDLKTEVKSWLGHHSPRVCTFLPMKASFYDQTTIEPETMNDRLTALGIGLSGGGLVITTFGALHERFFNPAKWQGACFKLGVGDTQPREDILKHLIRLGYTRVALVEESRQFAVRGSLIDIFPGNAEFPVRLDYFGDELESIKTFSPETQRTLDKIAEITITPMLEALFPPGGNEHLIAVIREIAETFEPTRQELLLRKLERLMTNPDSQDQYELRPYQAPGEGFLWDFWEEPRLFIESTDQLEELSKEFFAGQEQNYQKMQDLTPLLPPGKYYHSPSSVLHHLEEKKTSSISRFKNPHQGGVVFEVESAPPANDPSRESLLKDLRQWIAGNYAVVLILSDAHRFQNLKGLLSERKFPVRASPDMMAFASGTIHMFQAPIQRGFISAQDKIVVLCEDDLYPFAKSEQRPAKAPASHSWTISQLVPGDLVVHTDHGVAEFRGIQTLTAGGNTREYLLLQYAGSDKLYVPTDQVHKVQKYLGMEGFRPAIHSLNSKVWENQKKRVKKNVESIARELLELYARRQASSGFAFLPDNELQHDMESRFPYIETPDQAKAITAVKADMEADLPMDRIVCGDVGYGKTEVAIRAAFKSVCSGKQVAILAPTTLLAFQHSQTFRARLEGLPVQIGMVSRFVSAKEQATIMEKTAKGLVDILIGTHRILSKDIKFKDLGLLIIDEEQRFGVKHKERFKEMRENLDILTLTATPIPRTLHMALSGIRQISVIDTPPLDRRPIHTYVAPFDPMWTKRAIIEELKRGGQVYYVFNRVEKIDQKANQIRQLVPEARIAIAHGQMEESMVEKTMLSFIRREYDVLLATTIIESGLDIPNVNTLIVDEAERLGLAQMYQLRGRVGRSSRQAWAYFFYSKGKRLTQEAHDRLASLEEHTALGSGFKIALRDLQIRGAGNILGAEQSGHIAAIGFSLYIELLEEAVSRLSGKSVPRAPDTTIEIPITALFPAYYISEEDTRIEMYARLGRCSDLELLSLLKAECEDRFGRIPEEAERLFQVAHLRVLAAQSGVRKISQNLNRLRFEFDPEKMPDPTKIIDARVGFFRKMTFHPTDPNALSLSLAEIDREEIIGYAGKFLEVIGKPG